MDKKGSLFTRKKHVFLEWWQRPATRRDRVTGTFVGGFGFLWIGVLGRIMLGPMPISLVDIAWWALASIGVGVVLGVCFPKVITCMCFPFSIFGIGGS